MGHKKVVEERNLEIAKKSKENAEKQKAERLKMMENYEEPEWMKMSKVEESLQQLEANLDQSHGETGVRDDEEDGLYCVACDKLFRSDKAFANHEKSKKHKENVEILKEIMQEEDNRENGADYGSKDDEELQISEADDLNEVVGLSTDSEDREKETKKSKTKIGKKKKSNNKRVAEDSDSDDETNTVSSAANTKETAASTTTMETAASTTTSTETEPTINGVIEDENDEDEEIVSDDAADLLQRLVQQSQKGGKKKGKKQKKRKQVVIEEEEEDEEDEENMVNSRVMEAKLNDETDGNSSSRGTTEERSLMRDDVDTPNLVGQSGSEGHEEKKREEEEEFFIVQSEDPGKGKKEKKKSG